MPIDRKLLLNAYDAVYDLSMQKLYTIPKIYQGGGSIHKQYINGETHFVHNIRDI